MLKKALIRAGNFCFRKGGAKHAEAQYRRILVFCRQAIGDVIMAIPSFEALRNAHPEAHITFYTMEWNRGIAGLIGVFDEVKLLDNETVMHKSVTGLLRFVSMVRKERFDAVVTLDSFMFPLYFYLAGIPVRIGYEYDREGFALTRKIRISSRNYQVDNFLSLVELAGASSLKRNLHLSLPSHKETMEEIESLLPRGDTVPVIAVVAGGGSNPGGRNAAKNWSTEGFARVIAKLMEEHDASVLLCGKGEEDAGIAESVISMAGLASGPNCEGRIINLVDRTSLRQAAALFQRCDVVITNDTSLMHLAAAVGAPTVSIFGPTDPANLAPRGSRHRAIAASIPCAPCYDRKGYRSCGTACMREISWESVYREAVFLLEAGQKERRREENAHSR